MKYIWSVLLFGCSLSAQASFIGESVILQKFWPDLDQLQYQGITDVSDGFEFVFDDNVLATVDWRMDITANTITVESLMNFDTSFAPYEFNGWVLLDAYDGFDDIISVSVSESNVDGLNNSLIDFGTDGLALNWAGLDWNTDSMFVLDVLFAGDREENVQVPEPPVFLLMLLGMLGLYYKRCKFTSLKN